MIRSSEKGDGPLMQVRPARQVSKDESNPAGAWGGARDDRTLTVAVPTDRMDEVAGALHRGGLIPALVPDG